MVVLPPGDNRLQTANGRRMNDWTSHTAILMYHSRKCRLNIQNVKSSSPYDAPPMTSLCIKCDSASLRINFTSTVHQQVPNHLIEPRRPQPTWWTGGCPDRNRLQVESRSCLQWTVTLQSCKRTPEKEEAHVCILLEIFSPFKVYELPEPHTQACDGASWFFLPWFPWVKTVWDSGGRSKRATFEVSPYNRCPRPYLH